MCQNEVSVQQSISLITDSLLHGQTDLFVVLPKGRSRNHREGFPYHNQWHKVTVIFDTIEVYTIHCFNIILIHLARKLLSIMDNFKNLRCRGFLETLKPPKLLQHHKQKCKKWFGHGRLVSCLQIYRNYAIHQRRRNTFYLRGALHLLTMSLIQVNISITYNLIAGYYPLSIVVTFLITQLQLNILY